MILEQINNDKFPIAFIKWYSGMSEKQIIKAYERWKNENPLRNKQIVKNKIE